jgi:hypothetical protein
VGQGSNASIDSATAVGQGSNAGATGSTVVGQAAKVQTTSDRAVALGFQTSVGTGATDAIAIGTKGAANNIGDNAKNSIAIGNTATVSPNATNAIAIGTGAKATANGAVAIGRNAIASDPGTATGDSSVATGIDASAYGFKASATGNTSTAVGTNSSTTQTNASAFGANAQATGLNSTAIGAGAIATAPNQMTFGTANSFYTLPGLATGGTFAGASKQTGSISANTIQFVTVDQNGNLGTSKAVFDTTEIERGLNALGQQVQSVGALSAALSAIPNTLPSDSNGGCGFGTGVYGNALAGAVGCVARLSQTTYINVAGSFTSAPPSSNYSSTASFMGRIGIFFQF